MLKNYVKMAFKVFMRRKFFTFISLFAISFTLLVLMVATTLLDHMFGPFPPDIHADRTLGIRTAQIIYKQGISGSSAGYLLLDRYMRDLPGVERMTVYSTRTPVVSYWKDQKIELRRKRTDAAFWSVFAFEFLEGSPYTAQDVEQANFVAVLNQATKERFFGLEPAVGKTIPVDGQRLRVVGVVANVPAFRDEPYADLWAPITTEKSDAYRTQLLGEYEAALLARSRADFPRIKEAFYERLSRIELDDPKALRLKSDADTQFEHIGRDIWGTHRDLTSDYGYHFLGTIMVLMVLFMLLPAINLININVSRILERASEVGVRRAFGASSMTLVGQFVMENVLLTLIGGVIGFILSWGALAVIRDMEIIRYAAFHMNYRIFLYGLLIILFFGLLSGVYPAWKMSRLHPVDALRGGVR